MGNSTKTSAAVKPTKPHPDFPLFPHATRRWAKKILGKMHYFGPWHDPDAALKKWLDEKDDLLAGRKPRPKTANGVTVRRVVNQFLTAKASAHRDGELSDILFGKYYDTCERIIKQFGDSRPVGDLRPEDFGAYRSAMLAKWPSPVTVGCEIQRIRTVFKFASDNRIIPTSVDFGTMFKKPSRKSVRLYKQGRPLKLFSADEIGAVLRAAKHPLKAMILLGINAGWGNEDVAGVRERHLDLEAGVADYSRGKTAVQRRAPLWPETVKAVLEALAVRPTAALEADADRVFLTRYGKPWRVSKATLDVTAERKVKWKNVDSVGLEFGKLLRKTALTRDGENVALKRLGVNFYTLRHTFKTVGEETGDFPAVDRIMGHEDTADVGTTYREWASGAADDARLRRVTDHIRKWLFGQKKSMTSGSRRRTARGDGRRATTARRASKV